MKILILSCGGKVQPLIKSIEYHNPNYIYFLCSTDSDKKAKEIVMELDLSNEDYKIKLLDDFQSFDDCYKKSNEILNEIDNKYDEVCVDFTGGAKTMGAGLVLASIGQGFTYSYVASEKKEDRFDNGLGPVKDESGVIEIQKDPYDIYAIKEFEKALLFFNRYQFEAAESNLMEANNKLEDEKLKLLSNIYLDIIDIYGSWDKFKNKSSSNHLIYSDLKRIINDINYYPLIKKQIEMIHPNLLLKMQDNLKFLELKKGNLNKSNVKYYISDLLNNASRRIEENKYDDAVARLYRTIELIAQTGLLHENLINLEILESNKEFRILKYKIDENNSEVKEKIDSWPEFEKKDNIKLPLWKSYELLAAMGKDYAKEYIDDDKLNNKVDSRNGSILAHGLNPIEKEDSEFLLSKVQEYAKKVFPEVEEYMEIAKFPKFNID